MEKILGIAFRYNETIWRKPGPAEYYDLTIKLYEMGMPIEAIQRTEKGFYSVSFAFLSPMNALHVANYTGQCGVFCNPEEGLQPQDLWPPQNQVKKLLT